LVKYFEGIVRKATGIVREATFEVPISYTHGLADAHTVVSKENVGGSSVLFLGRPLAYTPVLLCFF